MSKALLGPRFEVWESRRGRFCNAVCRGTAAYPGDIQSALRFVNWKRKRIRVRTFYDRHLRRRVVQILVGDGYGTR